MNDQFKHLSDAGLKALFDEAVRALAATEVQRRAVGAELARRKQARKPATRGLAP